MNETTSIILESTSDYIKSISNSSQYGNSIITLLVFIIIFIAVLTGIVLGYMLFRYFGK